MERFHQPDAVREKLNLTKLSAHDTDFRRFDSFAPLHLGLNRYKPHESASNLATTACQNAFQRYK